MTGILRDVENNSYSYIKVVQKNILRFYPVLAVVVVFSLAFGVFTMLPDDFENLGQSAVASSLFANNILSMITTKNYWDVVNEYKPLMHTWYLGVLMQIYVVFPIIIACFWKKVKDTRKFITYYTGIVFAVSIVLYILPVFSSNLKFYFPIFRVYEVLAGALIALASGRISLTKERHIAVGKILLFIMLVLLLFVNEKFVEDSVRLLLVVIATSVLILLSVCKMSSSYLFLEPLAVVGRASYSIFLWHQVILAFLRYCFKFENSLWTIVVLALIISAFSIPSYLLLEKRLPASLKTEKMKWKAVFVCCVLGFMIAISGISINVKDGIVRDVPELGINSKTGQKIDHAAYCDRIYDFNKGFTSDKIRVLIIGDSYGRDWANILLESPVADKIEISYIYPNNENVYYEQKDRFDEADYAFYTLSFFYTEVPKQVAELSGQDKLYIVGSKSFGENNGHIYVQRNRDDYFDLTTEIDAKYANNNANLRSKWGDHYIDLIAPIMINDNEVRVFSDDDKFLSQDCRHLTQYGAKYYAEILDFSFISNDHE